jgi:hypothetical protein
MYYFTIGTLGIMKFRTVSFFLLFGLAGTLRAQNFAPVGAKWHYTEISLWGPEIDYTYFESLKDTVYAGEQCRKIGGEGNSCAWHSQFMFDRNDSVFFWHPQRQEFALLYNFGAQQGHSWTIHHITSGFGSGDPDSTILFVDSISSINVDNVPLKVLYTSILNSGENWWEFGGRIIERIGAEHLFPVFGVCDPVPAGLRCYNDSLISYHQGIYDCDEVISSVAEVEVSDWFLYPNPTYDMVSVGQKPHITVSTQFAVYDLHGREVIRCVKHSNAQTSFCIDLSNQKPGTYYLHIENDILTKVTKILKL